MALKSGRVGVRADQVDPYGRVKGGGAISVDIVNNLVTDDPAKALSASMGKALKTEVDTNKTAFDDFISNDFNPLVQQIPTDIADAFKIQSYTKDVSTVTLAADAQGSNTALNFTAPQGYEAVALLNLYHTNAKMLATQTGAIYVNGINFRLYNVSSAQQTGGTVTAVILFKKKI